MIDQKSLERAAKESAEKCQIKYGRDFTQAVDMFKRGAEWMAKRCEELEAQRAADRAALQKAVEAGTWFRNAAANFLKPDVPVPHDLAPQFYLTLSAEGDEKLLEDFRKYSEALARIEEIG